MPSITALFSDTFTFSWDALLAVANLLTPKLKEGHVVPEGYPGAGGKWPEYVPPKEGDSRSACPMLNAMANHGILPHDGKNISFKLMTETIRTTFNFAPSFCYFVPNYMARLLNKKYGKDTINLEDISLHNGIEHDASLTRQDTFHQPDQGKPHLPYVEELLDAASGHDKEGNPLLTADDVSRLLAKHRVEAKASNPEYSLSTFHKMFGSSNSATMLKICGGKIEDLRAMLVDERIPEGWEPFERSRMGLTFAAFNFTVIPIENGAKRYETSISSLAAGSASISGSEASGARAENQPSSKVAAPAA